MAEGVASNPLATGLYETMEIPNSLHVGTRSASKSRANKDHSCWMHANGRTACARLIVAALASDRPVKVQGGARHVSERTSGG